MKKTDTTIDNILSFRSSLSPDDILRENTRRNAALAARWVYDPVRGIGSYGARVEVFTPVHGLPKALVPEAMTHDPAYPGVLNDAVAWRQLRYKYDFEFWCVDTQKIKPKNQNFDIPFVLNTPQRRLLAAFEKQRLAGLPIRVILLKARQWGGSTLVLAYMAWIQLILLPNHHALICANTREAPLLIRGMYSKIIANYPEECWPDGVRPRLLPYEGSSVTRYIAGRGNRITVGTAESQDAIRGADYALAHLSEVAFWPETRTRSPLDFIRAICGSIDNRPLTMIVLESTANGVGNYFHNEWLRCAAGKGDKTAVFVPWFEIDGNCLDLRSYAPDDISAFFDSLTDYEVSQWMNGLTLEQINWYHQRALAYQDIRLMQAEFPGTPEEAFTNSGVAVFNPHDIECLRGDCTAPQSRAEITIDGKIVSDSKGRLEIWEPPRPGLDYVCAVDVGGRSDAADWSVIAVLSNEDVPRVVAQWRGHTDHDLLGLTAVGIAKYFNEAYLIIESNTLESADDAFDQNLSVLTQITREYTNLYMRCTEDNITKTRTARPGFHTNRRTKPLLVNRLIAAVRDKSYVERDGHALDEMANYIELPNGAYAARPGRHDDILMTRALALHALADLTDASAVTPADLAATAPG